MKAQTAKEEDRVSWNPNYSYRMVFLTNFIICLSCLIPLAVYFQIVISAFDKYGLSWNFMFLSALPCPPIVGTLYGLYIMREIYLKTFGMLGPGRPHERS